MKIINAGYEILDELNGEEILKKIERIARVCYQSEEKITDGSAVKMVQNLIKRGHDAMLEHFTFSVLFTVDRGVSHEIVRHRIASYAQESTRYCKYKDGATFIKPCDLDENLTNLWAGSMALYDTVYQSMLEDGATAQQARSVLPHSTKTALVMTTNLREWRHFFDLRAVGTTGKPHPQMLEVAVPLLKEVASKIPVVFDDLVSEVQAYDVAL